MAQRYEQDVGRVKALDVDQGVVLSESQPHTLKKDQQVLMAYSRTANQMVVVKGTEVSMVPISASEAFPLQFAQEGAVDGTILLVLPLSEAEELLSILETKSGYLSSEAATQMIDIDLRDVLHIAILNTRQALENPDLSLRQRKWASWVTFQVPQTAMEDILRDLKLKESSLSATGVPALKSLAIQLDEQYLTHNSKTRQDEPYFRARDLYDFLEASGEKEEDEDVINWEEAPVQAESIVEYINFRRAAAEANDRVSRVQEEETLRQQALTLAAAGFIPVAHSEGQESLCSNVFCGSDELHLPLENLFETDPFSELNDVLPAAYETAQKAREVPLTVSLARVHRLVQNHRSGPHILSVPHCPATPYFLTASKQDCVVWETHPLKPMKRLCEVNFEAGKGFSREKRVDEVSRTATIEAATILPFSLFEKSALKAASPAEGDSKEPEKAAPSVSVAIPSTGFVQWATPNIEVTVKDGPFAQAAGFVSDIVAPDVPAVYVNLTTVGGLQELISIDALTCVPPTKRGQQAIVIEGDHKGAVVTFVATTKKNKSNAVVQLPGTGAKQKKMILPLTSLALKAGQKEEAVEEEQEEDSESSEKGDEIEGSKPLAFVLSVVEKTARKLLLFDQTKSPGGTLMVTQQISLPQNVQEVTDLFYNTEADLLLVAAHTENNGGCILSYKFDSREKWFDVSETSTISASFDAPAIRMLPLSLSPGVASSADRFKGLVVVTAAGEVTLFDVAKFTKVTSTMLPPDAGPFVDASVSGNYGAASPYGLAGKGVTAATIAACNRNGLISFLRVSHPESPTSRVHPAIEVPTEGGGAGAGVGDAGVINSVAALRSMLRNSEPRPLRLEAGGPVGTFVENETSLRWHPVASGGTRDVFGVESKHVEETEQSPADSHIAFDIELKDVSAVGKVHVGVATQSSITKGIALSISGNNGGLSYVQPCAAVQTIEGWVKPQWTMERSAESGDPVFSSATLGPAPSGLRVLLLAPRQVFPSTSIVIRFAILSGTHTSSDKLQLQLEGSSEVFTEVTVTSDMASSGLIILSPEQVPTEPGPYELRYVSGDVLKGKTTIAVGDAELPPSELLPIFKSAVVAPTGAEEFNYALLASRDGKLYFVAHGTSRAGKPRLLCTLPPYAVNSPRLEANQWHHVAVSVSDVGIQVYLDGKQYGDMVKWGSMLFGAYTLALSGASVTGARQIQGTWKVRGETEGGDPYSYEMHLRLNPDGTISGSSPNYEIHGRLGGSQLRLTQTAEDGGWIHTVSAVVADDWKTMKGSWRGDGPDAEGNDTVAKGTFSALRVDKASIHSEAKPLIMVGHDNSGRAWDGHMTEVRLWKEARSHLQIFKAAGISTAQLLALSPEEDTVLQDAWEFNDTVITTYRGVGLYKTPSDQSESKHEELMERLWSETTVPKLDTIPRLRVKVQALPLFVEPNAGHFTPVQPYPLSEDGNPAPSVSGVAQGGGGGGGGGGGSSGAQPTKRTPSLKVVPHVESAAISLAEETLNSSMLESNVRGLPTRRLRVLIEPASEECHERVTGVFINMYGCEARSVPGVRSKEEKVAEIARNYNLLHLPNFFRDLWEGVLSDTMTEGARRFAVPLLKSVPVTSPLAAEFENASKDQWKQFLLNNMVKVALGSVALAAEGFVKTIVNRLVAKNQEAKRRVILDAALECLAEGVEGPNSFQSCAGCYYFLSLLQFVAPADSDKVVSMLAEVLEGISSSLSQRKDSYHAMLRTFFGRYDRPLDEDFDGLRSRGMSLLGFSLNSAVATNASVHYLSANAKASHLLTGADLREENAAMSRSNLEAIAASGTVDIEFKNASSAPGDSVAWIDLGAPCLITGVNLFGEIENCGVSGASIRVDGYMDKPVLAEGERRVKKLKPQWCATNPPSGMYGSQARLRYAKIVSPRRVESTGNSGLATLDVDFKPGGKYAWELRVVPHKSDNNLQVAMGVCTYPLNNNSYTSSNETWCVKFLTGECYHRIRLPSQVAKGKPGKVYRFELDGETNTLKYGLAGKPLDVVFTDLDSGRAFFPYVHFLRSGCKVDVVKIEDLNVTASPTPLTPGECVTQIGIAPGTTEASIVQNPMALTRMDEFPSLNVPQPYVVEQLNNGSNLRFPGSGGIQCRYLRISGRLNAGLQPTDGSIHLSLAPFGIREYVDFEEAERRGTLEGALADLRKSAQASFLEAKANLSTARDALRAALDRFQTKLTSMPSASLAGVSSLDDISLQHPLGGAAVQVRNALRQLQSQAAPDYAYARSRVIWASKALNLPVSSVYEASATTSKLFWLAELLSSLLAKHLIEQQPTAGDSKDRDMSTQKLLALFDAFCVTQPASAKHRKEVGVLVGRLLARKLEPNETAKLDDSFVCLVLQRHFSIPPSVSFCLPPVSLAVMSLIHLAQQARGALFPEREVFEIIKGMAADEMGLTLKEDGTPVGGMGVRNRLVVHLFGLLKRAKEDNNISFLAWVMLLLTHCLQRLESVGTKAVAANKESSSGQKMPAAPPLVRAASLSSGLPAKLGGVETDAIENREENASGAAALRHVFQMVFSFLTPLNRSLFLLSTCLLQRVSSRVSVRREHFCPILSYQIAKFLQPSTVADVLVDSSFVSFLEKVKEQKRP